MELPDHSINYHGILTAATACAVGDVMIPNAGATAYVLATTAARAGRGSEAVALSSYSGPGTGNVRMAQNGVLPASKSGLAVDAGPDRKLVRCSALGRIERVSSYTAGDDIIGYAELDGRVHLMFGLPFALIAAAGGITLGGANGDVVIRASSTTTTGVTGSNGDVLYKTGGVWTSSPAVQVPAGASGDVITNDGAGGLTNTPTLGASHGGTGLTSPGANGNVLTSNGAGAWTSSAPTSGAPVGASYVVIALDGTLTSERRLQGSTTITLTDGGANGDATLAVANTSITNTHVSGSAAIAYSKLNLASSIVNADVSSSAAIASTKIALTSTRVGFGNGSNQMTDDAGLTYDATNDRLTVTGAVRVAIAQNTTGVGIANNTGYFSRDAANTADLNILQLDSSDVIRLGTSGTQNVVISYETTAGFYNTDSAVYDFLVSEDVDISCRLPLKGNGGNSKPFQFKRAAITLTGTPTTPSSSEYECPILSLSGTPGAEVDLILPDVTGSFFVIENNSNQTVKPHKSGGSGPNILSSTIKIVFHNGSDYKVVT